MLQSAQSTAVQHVNARVDRGDSDTPTSGAASVRNVDEAVRREPVSDARDQRANAAPGQVFTGREQNAGARIIDLPSVPGRPAPTASLHALQEWEGYVLEVGTTDFVARLVDLTAGALHEEEEAIIPRAELSNTDDARMRAGGIFRWVIGYERSAAGTKKRVSQIVFRDLPAVTRSDLQDGEAWALETVRSLNP